MFLRGVVFTLMLVVFLFPYNTSTTNGTCGMLYTPRYELVSGELDEYTMVPPELWTTMGDYGGTLSPEKHVCFLL